jgi:thiol-disulfide isomerase/thioredoxin
MATFHSLYLSMLTFMNKLFSIFLFFFVLSNVEAQIVSLQGTAAEYKGKRVAVFAVEDYISEKRKLLQSAEISEDGKFLITFPVTETQMIIVHINRVEAVMYAEPGKTYRFVFPSDATADIKRFDKTEVELFFEELPNDDLNVLIRKFNSDFTQFISEHFYDFAVGDYRNGEMYLKKIGAKKMKSDIYKTSSDDDSLKRKVTPVFNALVVEFEQKCQQAYGDYENDFFADYMEFSLGEIELIAGMNRIKFYNKHFISRNLPLNNPAFMKCFHLYYDNFLLGHLSEKQAKINKAINVERDLNALHKIFVNDSTCLSEQIRTLALIKGLKDVYNNKSFDRTGIERTLKSANNADQRLNRIAENTHSQLTKTREGHKLEEFSAINEKGEKWTSAEFEEAPVYIMFFTTWNSASIKELQVMEKWHEKYGRDVQFYAVSLDDDYELFKKYLNEHRQQKFNFLYGQADPLISEKCSVYSIPHAVMLDSNGKTMFAFTRKPSEGIQAEFDKIALLNKQQKQGTKTWKD